MKLLLVALGMMSTVCAMEPELTVHIRSNKEKVAAQTKLAIILAEHDAVFDELAHTLKQALAASGQVAAEIMYAPEPATKQALQQYDDAGYQFALFLSIDAKQHAITGRLYDVFDAQMLQGKKWQRRDPSYLWAYTIAQDIWQQLLGSRGSFLSKIAYVSKKKGTAGRRASELRLTGWDGTHTTKVMPSTSILVAPTWSGDGERIFCSQFTDRNVRLIATDLQGHSWVVVDRDGTTMGASSAPGGTETVYCHSGEIWKCSYDAARKRSKHERIVRDSTMCASPTLLANGDIVYCAAGRIKLWHHGTGTIELLTSEGYCTGPAFHAPSRRVVYAQKVGKEMQLCVFDQKTGSMRQVTEGPGDKIDPTWSPCGTYVAYCFVHGAWSEIMVLNLLTGTQQRISAPGEHCSCPAWSPLLSF